MAAAKLGLSNFSSWEGGAGKFQKSAKAGKSCQLENFTSCENLKNREIFVIIYIESERESNSPLSKKIKNWVAAYARKEITMEKMTRRDFYTIIANAESLETPIRDYAKSALQKMDATNAARKEKPSKTQIANAPLIEQIVSMLTDQPQTATDLAEPMGIKVQKASALLRAAVAQGKANVQDVKVKSKGTQKGYTLAK